MKRLFALVCTVAIFVLIFTRVDRHALWERLRQTQWELFGAALFMFIPQFWFIAFRWKTLVSVFTPISMRESLSLILASQTLNIALPSKAGDLSKAVFLKQSGKLSLGRATNVVVYEKLLDVGSLAALMLCGVVPLLFRNDLLPAVRHGGIVAGFFGTFALLVVLVLYFIPTRFLPGFHQLLQFFERHPRLRRAHSLLAASHETISLLQQRGARRWIIAGVSVLIWILHLVQIALFFWSLHVQVPLSQICSLVPLAIFIGLIPITLSGFGTRDSAIILFFPAYPRAVMLGVALYINLRAILPALAGIPCLGGHLAGRDAGTKLIPRTTEGTRDESQI